MPVMQCRKDNKPGFKWGTSGTCYSYTPGDMRSRKNAYDKALKQGQPIKISQQK